VLNGRLNEARQWAADHQADSADPTSYLDEYVALTYARLMLGEHRAGVAEAAEGPHAALALSSAAVEAAERADRRSSLVEAHMVRALAGHASGDVPPAHHDIALALAEGVPSGFCRLFLDEGAPMEALLRSYLAGAGATGVARFARQLLDQTRPPSLSGAPATVTDALSDRERGVLRLLASDLAGPDIAAQLFISINTLRSHTKHIFTKLDVRTRRAAVRRAYELELL